MTGYVTVPSAPSNDPAKVGGWIGLYNCTNSGCPSKTLIVQSGFGFGTAWNGTTPDMWVEVYGNFNYNGHNCYTSFCGYKIAVTVGDSLYLSNFYSGSGYWTAYVQDDTHSGYTLYQVPGSTVGLTGTLPYATVDMEAIGASSNSYIPSPILFDTLNVYNPIGTQVNIDPFDMYQYINPTASSGVTETFWGLGNTQTASAEIFT